MKTKVKAIHTIVHNQHTIPAGTVVYIQDEKDVQHLLDAGAVERIYENESERKAAEERDQKAKADRIHNRNADSTIDGLKELPTENSIPVLAGIAGQQEMAALAERVAPNRVNPLDPANDNGKTVAVPKGATPAGSPVTQGKGPALTQEQIRRAQAESAARQAGKSEAEIKAAGDAAAGKSSAADDGLG